MNLMGVIDKLHSLPLGAAFKECQDSPQRGRVRRGAKAPRPQADLSVPWEPVGVGARLRATKT
jgi:hypothetical protein